MGICNAVNTLIFTAPSEVIHLALSLGVLGAFFKPERIRGEVQSWQE